MVVELLHVAQVALVEHAATLYTEDRGAHARSRCLAYARRAGELAQHIERTGQIPIPTPKT